MSEFKLIDDYFNWKHPPTGVTLGVGDDAAILHPPPGQDFLISVDTLISGVHFPIDTAAHAVAYKALATNLSDLAAMGATPRWFTLALTLPTLDALWLKDFSAGLRQLADQHNVFLIGGDTTRGTLSITIQIMGTTPHGKALRRSTAQVGDYLCVSGTLGDAAAGLALVEKRLTMPEPLAQFCIERLNYPSPRVELGLWLRDYASSCMDISDGLLADLNHLITSSQVGAQVIGDLIPLSEALYTLSPEKRLIYALTGGDDYELLFTIPAKQYAKVVSLAEKNNFNIKKIGEITRKVNQIDLDTALDLPKWGYNHFK